MSMMQMSSLVSGLVCIKAIKGALETANWLN